jgi:hypothetical protein
MTGRPDELAEELRTLLETRYAPTASLVAYSDLAAQLTTRMVRPEFMDRPLGSISKQTATETGGRIMLSALVVSKETLEPGAGFYRLARELGMLESRDHGHELEFWLEQLKRIAADYAGDASG